MSEKDKGVIPGRGFVFFADPNTVVPDIAALDVANPDTSIDGWTWLGLTSKDNMVALTKEGGEATSRDSWEYAGVRTEISASNVSATVNSLSITEQTLELAFPGGTFDEAAQRYDVPSGAGAVDKALLVLFIDAKNGVGGFVFHNAALAIGEMPSMSADGWFEIQLNANAQAGADGSAFAWYIPRPLATAGP